MWEGRPLRVKLEPLANPLVPQYIERLDVPVAARLHTGDQPPREFAHGGVQRPLDEHHAGIVLDHIIDLPKGPLLLLLKQRPHVLIQLCNLGRQLLGCQPRQRLMGLPMWQYDHQRWHSLHIKMFHNFFSLVAVDPMEEDSARCKVLPHPFPNHLLQYAARLVPARREKDRYHLISCRRSDLLILIKLGQLGELRLLAFRGSRFVLWN